MGEGKQVRRAKGRDNEGDNRDTVDGGQVGMGSHATSLSERVELIPSSYDESLDREGGRGFRGKVIRLTYRGNCATASTVGRNTAPIVRTQRDIHTALYRGREPKVKGREYRRVARTRKC